MLHKGLLRWRAPRVVRFFGLGDKGLGVRVGTMALQTRKHLRELRHTIETFAIKVGLSQTSLDL